MMEILQKVCYPEVGKRSGTKKFKNFLNIIFHPFAEMVLQGRFLHFWHVGSYCWHSLPWLILSCLLKGIKGYACPVLGAMQNLLFSIDLQQCNLQWLLCYSTYRCVCECIFVCSLTLVTKLLCISRLIFTAAGMFLAVAQICILWVLSYCICA